MPSEQTYDAFLSHSHQDAEIVEALAKRLEDDAGLRMWLDKWVLVPGRPWRQAMARGLDEAACCVVCVGGQTPRGWFDEEIGRALNRQTRDPSYGVVPLLLPGAQSEFVDDFLELRTWVDMRAGLDDEEAFRRLVAGIKGEAPGRGPDQSELGAWPRAWEEALTRYREHMKALHSTIRVLGYPKPVPLEGIYTDLYLLDKPTATRRFDIRQLQEDPSALARAPRERVDGLELIVQPETKRLFILGQPGAGKTTFLRYLTLCAARGDLGKVPIFVSLREWSDSGQDLIPFLIRQFEMCGFPGAKPFIKRVLEEGKALALFDGLDEVNREGGQRGKVIDALRDFSRQYLRSPCLITCRIAATEYQFEGFTYVEVAHFTGDQVETYVRKWFADDPEKGERFLNEVARAERRRLRQLSRTPLLLSMLCLAFGEAGTFPQRRAEFYGEALDALLRRWDSARRIERDEVYHRLSLRRKRQVLAHIAAVTLERREFFLHKPQLERQIAACLRSVVPAGREDDFDGEAVLKAIEAQHGILVERAHGIYAFAHPMFQEYFAAVYLTEPANQERLWRVLGGRVVDDRWREVFLLTASMLDEADSFFRQFVGRIEGLVVGDGKIIALLNWAEEKAARGGSKLEPVTVRCYYVYLAFDRALGRDLNIALSRDVDLDPGLDVDLDSALKQALRLAHDLDRVPAVSMDTDLDEAHFRLVLDWLRACRLYLECLQVAHVSDRAGLRDRLLRAPVVSREE